MLAFVGSHSNHAGRGGAGRSIVAAFGAAVERAQAESRARRRFRTTRNALLELDDRTLLDVTGLTHGQVRAMRGDRGDQGRLGLL
ncbi:MAG: hypothetical protein U5K33_09815 [Halofilum sp. (in: g-proteobacteria)]|nr:hypothetical protein [Halofilum sp. (in: g-proteobacteria)]